jgi:hypothetical protein
MQDPARTNALDHRLNPAWRVLQLAPEDASAWAVFRSQLLQEVDNDPTNGNVLRASTALDYLLSIPIPRERKMELLRDVQRFYDDPGSSKHKLLRRNALKHLIDLDPAARPEAVAELMRLYLG